MPISWDNVNDAKLITAFQQTSQVDYDAIARFMGQGCTVSAVKHRLARIREKAGIQGGRGARSNAANPANPASDIPATPRTPKASRARATGTSGSPGGVHSVSKRGRKNNTTTPTKAKRVGSSGPVHAKRGMETKKSDFKTTADGLPDLNYDDDALVNTSDEDMGKLK